MKRIVISLTIGLLFLTAILFVVDKFTNKRISSSITLLYLYLTAPRELVFEDMTIRVPFNFVANAGKESVGLMQYPDRDVTIVFKKSDPLTPMQFIRDYSYRLGRLEFAPVDKIEQKVNEESVYSIAGLRKSDGSDYIEYVYIPSKQIVVECSGRESGRKEFWSVLQSLKF